MALMLSNVFLALIVMNGEAPPKIVARFPSVEACAQAAFTANGLPEMQTEAAIKADAAFVCMKIVGDGSV